MSWFIDTDGIIIGPVSSSDVLSFLDHGKIDGKTNVIGDKMARWELVKFQESILRNLASEDDVRSNFDELMQLARESQPEGREKKMSEIAAMLGDQYKLSESIKKGGGKEYDGSTRLCVALGILCLLVGAFILMDPTLSSHGSRGSENIANFHMLTLGMTSSIIGAIFLAAGVRPR